MLQIDSSASSIEADVCLDAKAGVPCTFAASSPHLPAASSLEVVSR